MAKKRKYSNKITMLDGMTFDSKKEANYYAELKMLKMAGEIVDIRCQVPFELQPKFNHNGKEIRAIKYIADFVVTYADGKQKVIDVKGYKTDVYTLKMKMLLYKYPHLNFEEK